MFNKSKKKKNDLIQITEEETLKDTSENKSKSNVNIIVTDAYVIIIVVENKMHFHLLPFYVRIGLCTFTYIHETQ